MMYRGIIIKESIGDENLFDFVKIVKTELWRTKDVPKYWTAVYFESDAVDFPEKVSKAITGNWYVDMKVDDVKILAFKDKVMRYHIGDLAGRREVMDYCASIGIPESQMDWSE